MVYTSPRNVLRPIDVAQRLLSFLLFLVLPFPLVGKALFSAFLLFVADGDG